MKLIFRLFLLTALFVFSTSCARKSSSTGPEGVSNSALFPGTKPITLISPPNQRVMDREITFMWNPSGQQQVALGLFEAPIQIVNGNIQNKNDNIWAWHSGLKNGQQGLVKFSDGYGVENGIWQNQKPIKITNGKQYYWAVWAWDNNGTITHSSEAYNLTFQQTQIVLTISGVAGDTANISKFLGSSITDDGTSRPRTIAVWSNDWNALGIEIDGQHLFGSINASHIVGISIPPPPPGWQESWRIAIDVARENKIFQVSFWKN